MNPKHSDACKASWNNEEDNTFVWAIKIKALEKGNFILLKIGISAHWSRNKPFKMRYNLGCHTENGECMLDDK